MALCIQGSTSWVDVGQGGPAHLVRELGSDAGEDVLGDALRLHMRVADAAGQLAQGHQPHVHGQPLGQILHHVNHLAPRRPLLQADQPFSVTHKKKNIYRKAANHPSHAKLCTTLPVQYLCFLAIQAGNKPACLTVQKTYA